MIPRNMVSFKFLCVLYQCHRQTLPIMNIDRGQIQFREYVATGTEPKVQIRHRIKIGEMPDQWRKSLYTVIIQNVV